MAIRLSEFDTWRPGYGLATVTIVRAGTDVLATVYSDEDLQDEAANPQTLLGNTVGETSYGKWSAPLYVGLAVELHIDTVDRTGVIRPPLDTLDGEVGNGLLVTVDGGSEAYTLADHLGRRIDARDYGEFVEVGVVGASAATNSATLQAAIGVAGAAGGGYVEVPDGFYTVNPFSIPLGVVVRGQGRGATTLQCNQASRVCTIAGDRAGLSRLTLDGVSVVAGSVGVYSVANDQIVLDDVEIKRFAASKHIRGGENMVWEKLYISDCADGSKLHGDTDAGDSGLGKRIGNIRWIGGRIDLCSVTGLDVRNVDAPCGQITLEGVEFDTNTGTALSIIGARGITIIDPVFVGNTVDLEIADGSPLDADNSIANIRFLRGRISGGEMELSGTLESVVFQEVEIDDVDITLTSPLNNVLALDCREINDVTLAGTSTAWLRSRTTDKGESFGITTSNGATKAWGIALDPGQRVFLTAKVVGRQKNGTNDGFYFVAVSARRPGSALAYDTQTGNFTVGNLLTGATSGATGRITADADGGATGTLTLQDIDGVFVDNEIVTDGSGGSAMVNGALVAANVALAGTNTDIRAVQETNANWACAFAANGPEIELRVTGDTGQTVEWTVEVEVVSS
ncbi:hypothetical protein [Mesorhizobium onobrychidis]|uniref:Pectate lyase superfamily protein domain-containing protein n=1 Tax=Mesorhizobium onobrychidis TaxID=2775404 RepID=A0ABY5QUW3_9HYPH|nr:hypothetical protein [Mesorhizobium onobrychidis]UVC14704.1 hypothetical protein IHQ72_29495 [Mesorhizobium onobrychidis]